MTTQSEPYVFDTCCELLNTLDEVNDQQIQRFHDQGYLAVRRALSPQEVEVARQAIWDLIDGKVETYKGVQAEGSMRKDFRSLGKLDRREAVRKIFRFVEFDDRLMALSNHDGIHAVLAKIMGEPAKLFQDMGLIKPPRIGQEKPWHQDSAYFNLSPETDVVGVWIALDEATADNGCLHVIPGSNGKGTHPHFKRRDWQICDTDIQLDQDVMVELPPGGCLFWHGLTHHGSPSNRSDMRRRALQYHYCPQSAKDITVDERLAIYGGEGLGVEC